MEINQELAEICGVHAGDGYLRNRKNKIELDITGNVEEKEYYSLHVIPLFNKFFGLNLVAKQYVKGTYGFVTTNNKFRILNKLGFSYGKKSLTVFVPQPILLSNNVTLYSRFLRGLFDTDGNLSFRKSYGKYTNFKIQFHHYPIIRLTTISPKLSEGVSFMLNKLEINHFLYVHYPKKDNESPAYIIIISGVERVNRWMDLVGSKNSVKFSRYLVWKKFGFCPTNTSLKQREDILSGKLDIYNIGS
jgi:hypothetical protein